MDHAGNITQGDGNGLCYLNSGSAVQFQVAGNSKAAGITFQLTFAPQFAGKHEVYAVGTDSAGLQSPQQDLGPLVVTQGPDFTISATPATITAPVSGLVPVTFSVASVNGFSGSVTPSVINLQNPPDVTCAYVWSGGSSVDVSNGSTGYTTIEFQIENSSRCVLASVTGTVGGQTSFGGSPVIWGVRTAPQPGITFNLIAAADFTVTVGSPQPATLAANGSVSYPVTVTSMNGFSGYVSFSSSNVVGLPCNNVVSPPSCVAASFNSIGYTSSEVYVSAYGSAGTTLILSGGTNLPGGAWPITVTGTASGGSPSHTSGFTLDTQVTVFSGSTNPASNSGTTASSTLSLTSSNSTTFSSCGSGDSTVTCTASSSQSGPVTVTVTASNGSQSLHGSRLLNLNGEAGQVLTLIVDQVPTISGSTNLGNITAGQLVTFTLSGSGLDPAGLGDPGYYSLDIQGPNGAVSWGYIQSIGAHSFQIALSPDPGASLGDYDLYLDLCEIFFGDSDDPDADCEVPLDFYVNPPACPFPVSEKSGNGQWCQPCTGGTFTATLYNANQTAPPNGEYQGRTVSEALSNDVDTCYFAGSDYAKLNVPPQGQWSTWTVSSINAYGGDLIAEDPAWVSYYQGLIKGGSHQYPNNTCSNSIVQKMSMNACVVGNPSQEYWPNNTTVTVAASQITATRGNASASGPSQGQ